VLTHPPHHPCVDRRRFLLTSLAGAFAVPLAAEAQQGGRVWRLGLLTVGFKDAPTPSVTQFARNLCDLVA
jgi:hypothetical protein